jgi:hypothetical protein
MLERVLPGMMGAGLALFAVGCSGESEVESEPALSDEAIASFEGSYVLESFNENPSGCDTEGASTFADKVERRFVLVGAGIRAFPFLDLSSCTDETDCVERTAAIRNRTNYSNEYGLILSAERDPDALTGLSAGSGYLRDGTCTERDYVDHELVREGDLVRVTSRSKLLADKAPVDGFCVAQPSVQKEEALERDCSALTTFTGRRSAPLP